MADSDGDDLPGVGSLDPVRLAVGAVVTAGSGLTTVVRSSLAVAQRLPLVGSVLVALDQRGAAALRGADGETDRAVQATVRKVVAAALRDVDLTDLIDDRVDLVVLANRIVDGVDLQRIIRESTGSMSSEAVAGVRTQGMRADDAVSVLVDRVLRRTPPVLTDQS
jgi:hypothetical protein